MVVIHVETTDEFGIAYQPKRRNFNTSEGPPLLVVEEFDEEIATRLLNTTAKPVDEEDEFDLDIESNENNTENSETIRKALENAALAATTASNQELPTTTTKTPAAQEVPVSGSSASAGVATFASIMEEAKNALAEVAEVYGSGLGDHEVHLMFSSSQQVENGSNSNNTAQQQTATLGCVGAIEEGDEEAAELEEELEEVRAVETVKAAAEATSQLESEWDNLDPARTGKPSSGPTDDVKCTQESTTSLSAVVVTEKWKYSKALQLFKTADHSAYIGSIVVREEGKGGWFSAAPKPLSYTGWKEDLDLPFLLAQIDYDPQSRAHYGMLSTIYSTLLLVDGEGNSSSSSSSKKWEKLGFQGNDPRTDLNRSMKMLSVVQVNACLTVVLYSHALFCFILFPDVELHRARHCSGTARVRPLPVRPGPRRGGRSEHQHRRAQRPGRTGHLLAVHVRGHHVHQGGATVPAERSAQR